jgi:hypothetical protein
VLDDRLDFDRLGHASAFETHRTTNNAAIAKRNINPFSFQQITRPELGSRTTRVPFRPTIVQPKCFTATPGRRAVYRAVKFT